MLDVVFRDEQVSLGHVEVSYTRTQTPTRPPQATLRKLAHKAAPLVRRRVSVRSRSGAGTRPSRTRAWSLSPSWWRLAAGSGRRFCRFCASMRPRTPRSARPCWHAPRGRFPSSPSAALRPCSSQRSRGPRRCRCSPPSGAFGFRSPPGGVFGLCAPSGFRAALCRWGRSLVRCSRALLRLCFSQ